MNIRQLKENIGTVIKLLPRPKLGNEYITAARNKWLIVCEQEEAKGLDLTNTLTQHGFLLPYDSIREFRSPDLLILRSQIVLSESGTDFIPFTDSPDDKQSDETLRESDITVFRRLNAIADEALIDDMLNGRIYNSRLKLEDDHVLADLIDALIRIENRYLDEQVQQHSATLAQEMGALLTFVRQTFWSVPSGWLKFRPDPIDPKVYDSEWKELCRKIDNAWSAYRAYRTTVKERLRV